MAGETRSYCHGRVTPRYLAAKLDVGLVVTDVVRNGHSGGDVVYFRRGTEAEIADCRRRLAESATKPEGACSRCRKAISDFHPPDGGMTAGYYVAAGWAKYANPGEVYICDACMWADPRYIADFGPTPAGEPPHPNTEK